MLTLIGILPVVLVLIYIRRVDRFHQEPKKLLNKLFIYGALSVIPIIFIELFFMRMNVFTGDLGALYDSFIVAGFTEESFKWLIVIVVAFNNKAYDEPLDGIVYAVFVSMGFAVVENVLYVYSGGIQVALLRAVTSVPAHMVFGVMSGYMLSIYKFERKPLYLVLSLIVPICLHGLYNFMLLANSFYLILFIPYLITLYVLVKRRIKKYQMISIQSNEEIEI